MRMINQPGDLFSIHDDGINRIVQDYRSGRIDDAAFKSKVAAWKEDWHREIATMVPGHRLEVLVNAKSGLPLFRLNPDVRREEPLLDASTGLPKHLLPATNAPAKPRGPAR